MKSTLLNILRIYRLSGLLFLFSLCLPGPALFAEAASASAPQATDLLAEALPILQAKYPDFKKLPVKEGDHLSDLIARSDGKISLDSPENGLPPGPILTASLPDNLLYWRVASFTPATTWADLAAKLAQQNATAQGIVLDLRSNLAPDDYRGAAQILALFAPGDETLNKFKALAPGNSDVVKLPDHPFHAPIVVLTNNETTGAAEVLAACLRADGALLVGRPTAGKIALFEEQKLSSGQILRYVVAPVEAPDSNGKLKLRMNAPAWGQPVLPDIALTVNDVAEKRALIMIAHNRVTDVIEEAADRHRMSEAALVQGDDPEWDSYLASLGKNGEGHLLLSLPSIHDVALIGALDSLKAIQFAERPALSPAGTAGRASASLE